MTLPWPLPVTLGCPGVITPQGATLCLIGGTPDVTAECDGGGLPWPLPISLGERGVLTPTGVTLTLTGGIPTVIAETPGILPWTLPATLGAGPGIITPPGAALTLAAGTPDVIAGTVITPDGAALALAGGIPATVLSAAALNGVIGHLANNQDATILTLGDSTVRGTLDTSNPFLYGWPGRLAILLGTVFDVNVYVNADTTSASKINNGWGASTATLYTSTQQGAATLTLYNGAVGGSTLADQETYITHNHLLEYAAAADVIFIGTGFNDIIGGLTNTEYVAAYQTFVANIQSAAPGVPIIITTENQTNFTYGNISQSLFYSAFTALSEAFVGQPLPLTPPLAATAGVSVLDTQQAFDGYDLTEVLSPPGVAGSGDNLHPTSFGYTVEAQWIMSTLISTT